MLRMGAAMGCTYVCAEGGLPRSTSINLDSFICVPERKGRSYEEIQPHARTIRRICSHIRSAHISPIQPLNRRRKSDVIGYYLGQAKLTISRYITRMDTSLSQPIHSLRIAKHSRREPSTH